MNTKMMIKIIFNLISISECKKKYTEGITTFLLSDEISDNIGGCCVYNIKILEEPNTIICFDRKTDEFRNGEVKEKENVKILVQTKFKSIEPNMNSKICNKCWENLRKSERPVFIVMQNKKDQNITVSTSYENNNTGDEYEAYSDDYERGSIKKVPIDSNEPEIGSDKPEIDLNKPEIDSDKLKNSNLNELKNNNLNEPKIPENQDSNKPQMDLNESKIQENNNSDKPKTFQIQKNKNFMITNKYIKIICDQSEYIIPVILHNGKEKVIIFEDNQKRSLFSTIDDTFIFFSIYYIKNKNVDLISGPTFQCDYIEILNGKILLEPIDKLVFIDKKDEIISLFSKKILHDMKKDVFEEKKRIEDENIKY